MESELLFSSWDLRGCFRHSASVSCSLHYTPCWEISLIILPSPLLMSQAESGLCAVKQHLGRASPSSALPQDRPHCHFLLSLSVYLTTEAAVELKLVANHRNTFLVGVITATAAAPGRLRQPGPTSYRRDYWNSRWPQLPVPVGNELQAYQNLFYQIMLFLCFICKNLDFVV